MSQIGKISVGYEMKRPAGEQFSSHGAHVTIDLTDLGDEATKDKLRASIRHLFTACREEVEAQMQVQPRATTGSQGAPHGGYGGGQGGQGNGGNPRMASEKQVKAIFGIGKGLNLSIQALKDEAKVARLEDLTQSQASNFIESLKAREVAQQSQGGGAPNQAKGECPF